MTLGIASSVALSDDCDKILEHLSKIRSATERLGGYEDWGNIPGIVSLPTSITEAPRGNPNSLNSPHHPEYLRAKLSPQPKLKYRAISYHRAEVKAAQPAISDEHYLAVEGDRPYVYKVDPRTQRLTPVKNTFDSVKHVEKALAWGPNRTLVAAERDGSISILRLNPEENILNFLSKLETGGEITADPVWGPDNTVVVSTQEKNKNYLLLLRFAPETGGLELLDKHEMPDFITANIVRPDGTLASIGSKGHLSVFKVSTAAKKLAPLNQTQVEGEFSAKPSLGPHHTLAVLNRNGRLFVLHLNPKTNSLEIKDRVQMSGRLKWGSIDFGMNNLIAVGGDDDIVRIIKIDPETKHVVAFEELEMPGPQSFAWGPEGTLAVAGSVGLYVFKMNPQTGKMDLVDNFYPRDRFYLASLAWGPNATLIVNSLTGTYSFKLSDGRSWFSAAKDLFKKKSTHSKESSEPSKILDTPTEGESKPILNFGAPDVWSDLLRSERERVKQ